MKTPRLFGTNGIRGVAGKEIDSGLAFRVGSALGTLFPKRRVLIGRDSRASSPMLLEGVAAGLLRLGNDVDDYGLITTPALEFLVKTTSFSAGVMITASHNPPEYNGFKVVDSDGIEIARGKEETIEGLFPRKSWKVSKSPGQRTKPPQPLEPYLSSLGTYVARKKVEKGVTVVVDT